MLWFSSQKEKAMPHRLDSPPAIPDDLAEEILLRLPPDESSCLLRASLVCKPWRRIASRPDFLRRLHARHRTPPLLGFLHNLFDKRLPRFIPTTASAFSLAVPDRRDWSVLDCRHGRALLFSSGYCGHDLLVWEPITGHQRGMRAPAAFKGGYFKAAVVCAADGCDHRDCHGGPFRVVSVFTVSTDVGGSVTSACVYSSETGAWGKLSSVGRVSVVSTKPSTLVGKSLLYFPCGLHYILEYDLAGPGLAVVDLPDMLVAYRAAYKTRIVLMPAEGGGLGVARVEESCLYLWSRDSSSNGDAGWVQSRAIDLDNLLPVGVISASRTAKVIGFVEEGNTIFLCTITGVFTIDIESERVRKVYETKMGDLSFAEVGHSYEALFPFISFYIPGKQVAAAGGDEGTVNCSTVLCEDRG